MTIASDGLSVLYQPDTDANGDDTFTYMLEDGAGSTDTATVHVTITPTNDDPIANDDSVAVTINRPPVPVDVLGNDTDIDGDDPLLVVETGTPSKGSATITGGGSGV